MPDFRATNLGSLIALRPISDDAKQWCTDHLPDDAQWFAGAVAIEPRYFEPIYEGILEDGLSFAET